MDVSNLAMIALYPDEESKALIEDIVAWDSLAHDLEEWHLTIEFLGDASSLPSNIFDIVDRAPKPRLPLYAGVTGSTIFGDIEQVFVLLIDSPELTDIYVNMRNTLRANGVPAASSHGFIPHVTVSDRAFWYEVPKIPLTFDRMDLVIGGNHYTVWDIEKQRSKDMLTEMLNNLGKSLERLSKGIDSRINVVLG